MKKRRLKSASGELDK